MKANVEYGLRGAFKVDTYDGQGNFVESSDWFDNFITQSGLMYPTLYSFANCFRFLTLGTSSNNNRGGLEGTNTDTTGCYSPIQTFNVSDGTTQNGTWMGYEAYETGTDPLLNSSCRTVINSNGIRFFRSWQVPSGAIGTTVNETGGSLNIQEFAVSPSSGGDPLGCFAFSRVQRNLPLKNGYRAIISYQLQINCLNYNRTRFPSGTFLTGNADTTNDYDLIDQWGKLSGYYKQVWPGLSCIDSYGVTFIPKYGKGLEPSLTDLSNYFLYFSPDNAAFDVNPTGAGHITDNPSVVWGADGLMSPLNQALTLTQARQSLGGSKNAELNLFYGPEQALALPTATTPTNIRLGSYSAPLKTANTHNYTTSLNPSEYLNPNYHYQGPDTVNASAETLSYATPGASGLNLTRAPDYQQKAIFSTRMYKMPMDFATMPNYNVWTGRRKNISRKTVFSPASSLGYNTRFGSMVFAYLQNNDTLGDYTFYPIMDSLFYDNSGHAQLQHYRLISGIYLTERGSGVAGCSITIRPAGPNVQRLVSRRTFQGPLTGYVQVPGWVTDPTGAWRYGNLLSGNTGVVPTSGNSAWFTGSAPTGPTGCSGWGAVIGVMGDDYNNPADAGWKFYDMGIADHNTGSLVQPTGGNPSQLYWPYAYVGPAMYVDFHDIVFFSGYGTTWKDTPNTSVAQLTASGFRRPTGFIVHYDGIGGTGFRLLPHFGMANTSDTNTYSPPTYGGVYPALSFDNGMEVYLDITWSSDCRGAAAGTCVDPP
jgi:hypothetical protein